MEKKTVKELQKLCRDAGLKTSGNKQVLIERLEYRSAQNTLHDELIQRINELENMVAGLRPRSAGNSEDGDAETSELRTGSFIPNIISSPRVTIRNAAPQVIHTTIAKPASTSQYMGVPPDIHTTTVQNHSVQPASTAQLTGVHQYASVPQYTSASQYMGVPQAVQMPTWYPRAMPTVVQPINTPLYYAAAPIINAVQSQGATHAPSMSIKDIIAVLPEYDPTSEDSLTSIQFVQRIQMLMNAYGWRDDLVIFATQQKLKGHAKLWADAQAEIFVTWKQFAEKIVEAFPFDANAASAHIKMANTKREFNENPKNFYFRMLAMGTRFGMTQGAIARHIINGINDPDLRKKISNDYVMCSELLRDIESYCRYNEVRAGPSRPKESSSPMVANLKVVANNAQSHGGKQQSSCKQRSKHIKASEMLQLWNVLSHRLQMQSTKASWKLCYVQPNDTPN